MSYPYVQCRWRTITNGRRVDLIVLHTAETPEGVDTAMSVARYFATTTTKASAHYCVDGGGHIVQTCLEKDVAYAAPGANHNGVHVELAGRAAQTDQQWHDSYSYNLLATVAPLVRDLCAIHKIPVRYVPAAQLAAGGAGARGITTHADVSRAFRKSTHWDPGPHFPMVEFVNAVLGGTPAPAPVPPLYSYANTLNGVPVRSFTVRIPTDGAGDGSAPSVCPVGKFISATGPGAHDKYAPGTKDTDSIVVPVGWRDDGGMVSLTVAGGPRLTEVHAWVTVAD